MGMGFAPTWLRQVSPRLHKTTLTTGLTGEQSVPVVLLEHATDPRDVLDGKLEHDQLHRSLAHHVEVFQEAATSTYARHSLSAYSTVQLLPLYV